MVALVCNPYKIIYVPLVFVLLTATNDGDVVARRRKKARMKERKTERRERENVVKDTLRQSARYYVHYNDMALLTGCGQPAHFLRPIFLKEPATGAPLQTLVGLGVVHQIDDGTGHQRSECYSFSFLITRRESAS